MVRPGAAIAKRAGVLLLPIVSIVWAIVATIAARNDDGTTMSLAGTSVTATAAVGAGWAAVIGGAALVLVSDSVPLGLAFSALGIGWFAPALTFENALPPPGQLVASWAGSLTTAGLIAAVAVVLRRPGAKDLMTVAALAAAAGSLAALARTLFSDPFRDLGCRVSCAPNRLVIVDFAWAREPLGSLENGLASLCCVTGLVIAIRRLTGRGPVNPACLLALGALACWAAGAGAEAAGSSLAAFMTVSVLLLVLAAAAASLRTRRRRGVLSRIAVEAAMTAEPDGLRRAVASALDDPTVEIAFLLQRSGRFVDGSGVEVLVPNHRKSVRLVRDNRLVALVMHTSATVHDAADFGATLVLAIENEALRLELDERFDELRSRRAEIVHRADARRLTLERDLHDGAQQGLLGILLQLRALRARVPELPGCLENLDGANAAISGALTDLREIAHGAHPSILTSAGLDEAVRSLAVRSRVPLDVTGMAAGRLTPALERVAFRIIADAVEEAAAAGATSVSLEAHREGETVRMDFHHDARLGDWSDLLHDRVGAAGGLLAHGPGRLEIELPCG